MNRLSREQRVQVLSCLVEGCSIRSTVRMTGVAKNTVTKLLVEVGIACGEYQFDNLVDLPCKRIQADEIWSFCYDKDKNLPDKMKDQDGVGSIWTWTAICADTKLAVLWMIGKRNTPSLLDRQSILGARRQCSLDGISRWRRGPLRKGGSP